MKPSLKLAVVLGLCPAVALAGDFIDTRVTFALANSNVFVKPGETTPSEPGTGFGAARQNTQFYDNFNTRYNFGCALSVHLEDKQAALDMLGPAFEMMSDAFLPYAKADPDLDLLPDDPRFHAMVAKAEARVAAAKSGETAAAAKA